MPGRLFGGLWLVALLAFPHVAWANEQAWNALREGRALLLMRHATAPGLGDPAGFVLSNCSTQRNLDSRGRAEAQRWGELLRSKGITRVQLFSSRWCRALDTAREMALGEVRPLPSLDSFITDRHRSDVHTAALRRDLEAMPPGDPLVLVSHQVNITALTGIFPRSGEAAILELPLADPVRVLARVPTP